MALVLVFIIIPYFVDQLDGFVNLVLQKDWPIAKAYKTPLLLFSIIYTFLFDRSRKYSLMLFIYLLLFAFSTILNIHDQYSDLGVISSDLGYNLKIFSLPILYFFFVVFYRQNPFPSFLFIRNVFLFLFYAFGAAILLSYMGFGLSFYGMTQEGESIGQQGYFSAGNEIGGFLILIASLFYYYAFRTKSVFYMFASFGITMAIGLLMGSKTAMITSFICFIGVFYLVKIYDRKTLVITRLDASLIITFAGMIFLTVLFINQILDFLHPTIRYFTYRYNLSGDMVRFLTSGRLDRAEAVLNNYFNNLSFMHMLFGQGYTYSKTFVIPNTHYTKAEMDFPDFLSICGLVGATLIYLFWLYLWIRVFREFRHRKNELATPLLLALGILIINSNISGHIIYSNIITPSLAYIAAFVIKAEKNTTSQHEVTNTLYHPNENPAA